MIPTAAALYVDGSAQHVSEKVFLYGAGGHAKVVMDVAEACEVRFAKVLVDEASSAVLNGVPVFCVSNLNLSHEMPFRFIVGIGDNEVRSRLFCYLATLGKAITLIHPFSLVSKRATLAAGVVIMPGAIVNSSARIGANVIINTAAVIDHDSIVDEHAHICPGVRLAGNVRIGSGSLIGTGTSIIPGVVIGRNCLIGAGSVVLRDIQDNSVAYGNPARIVRRNNPFEFSSVSVP